MMVIYSTGLFLFHRIKLDSFVLGLLTTTSSATRAADDVVSGQQHNTTFSSLQDAISKLKNPRFAGLLWILVSSKIFTPEL
jgi:hypothetical protein